MAKRLEWRQNNRSVAADYYHKNKRKILEQQKIYYQKNKKQILATKLAYKNKEYATNPLFKITKGLRGRLRHAIRDNYKTGSAIKDLGCTIAELKIYLENKFKKGMSWDNWGKQGWHLDHIKPLASFDLTNREDLLVAVHYTNLQPLWAKENLSKNRKG